MMKLFPVRHEKCVDRISLHGRLGGETADNNHLTGLRRLLHQGLDYSGPQHLKHDQLGTEKDESTQETRENVT
jgi:hypothetical protein